MDGSTLTFHSAMSPPKAAQAPTLSGIEQALGFQVITANYIGAPEAYSWMPNGYTISNLETGAPVVSVGPGFFLSTGGLPGDFNTSGSFTVVHGTPGYDLLTQTVQAALPNAGATNDAAVLEITFDSAALGGATAISFDIIFGSEEYPVYVDSSFVDIAAVYMNGVNYALFNDNPNQPLSITSSTVFTDSNWISNTNNLYNVEYNGFSTVLTVTAPIQEGLNELIIGIADTGDSSLDSGIFVGNIQPVGSGISGSYIWVYGTIFDDLFEATTAPEIYDISLGGIDQICGTPAELNNDIIYGWNSTILITVEEFFATDFFWQWDVYADGTIGFLDIDTTGDGVADTFLTIDGEKLDEATVNLSADEKGTTFTIAPKPGSFVDKSIDFAVLDVTYIGAPEAFLDLPNGYTISNIETGAPKVSIGPGFFLSTGGLPGDFNTSPNFSVNHGEPGYDLLDQAANDAFAGAGKTNDAAVLEIKFDSAAVGGATAISFDLVFGSEEYPNFVNSSFVDIAAVFVNGVNYALFNNDPTQPLAITSDTVFTPGNWISNVGKEYDVEYNGFSNVLTVTAPIQPGMNEIVIGIADTGDFIYDSGLFVGNIQTSFSSFFGSYISIDQMIQEGTVLVSVAPEVIQVGTGETVVSGTPEQLNGDVILGWNDNTSILLEGVFISIDSITITKGSAILEIDTTGDGVKDTKIHLDGNFDATKFDVIQTGEGTKIVSKGSYQFIQGTPGDDVLIGGTGPNEMIGGAGNDTILGGPGNDTIWAGAGDDKITVNAGNNLIGGGPGADTIKGGAGNDTIWAGADNDVIESGGGNNIIGLGAGDDKLTVNGNGNNIIYGGQANADGSLGSNTITIAGTGNNTVFNGIGNDKVILASGANGNNLLWGGPGDDIFNLTDATTKATVAFVAGNGNDTIQNFNLAAEHYIDFSNMSDVFGSVADVQAAISSVGFGTSLITVSDTQSVLISVAADALIAANPDDWLIL